MSTPNLSISSVEAARMHGRRYEILIEQAGYSQSVMHGLRKGFQQVQIQDGVNAVMPSSGVRVNDNSIQITNPAGPGTNFFFGGDNNNYFDSSGGGGGGTPGPAGPPGATGPAGADGADGAPGSGAFWEEGDGTTLDGNGASLGSAYSVSIDPAVSATTDLVESNGYKLLALDPSYNGGDIFHIDNIDDTLKFSFRTVKLEVQKNDGGAVVGLLLTDVAQNIFTVKVEDQSCPPPCLP
jgi:hypothetical protein